ncbi:thiamine-phosphate kinase [Cumulibacter manganitolerans]|uniref:thiamine-phosphate kinase n=1 Tax=Cumulibacter manganitolerans TaxID=1884992 RepID=UPI001295EE74|nr:thiamine-phosphate kinase [Cumulibacter manganitolerans]
MHNENPTISDAGEFPAIERITRATAGSLTDEVLLGPGDDAAVVSAADGRVVISTDVFVEDRHFRRDWSGPQDIGHRVIAAALADIAAMGARPTAAVVGLACPADTPLSWLDGFSTGVAEECAAAGAALVGGDMSRSDTVFVSVTGLGDLAGAVPVTRAGARDNDVVAVAGHLGYAAAGLAILSRGFRTGKVFIDAHRRPAPPYTEGPRASLAGASAMCDVSDGLVADLEHIARASNVAIDLDASSFDIPARMAEIASAIGADPLQWVTAGGEDHALAATFAPDDVPDGWRVVGAVRSADEPAVTIDGRAPEARGWTHFGRA